MEDAHGFISSDDFVFNEAFAQFGVITLNGKGRLLAMVGQRYNDKDQVDPE